MIVQTQAVEHGDGKRQESLSIQASTEGRGLVRAGGRLGGRHSRSDTQ